jgi:exportin-7
VQLASVRRSLFNNEERQKFLAALVRGISLVLKNGNNLSNLEVYHEFCRLLGRLKANYQLGELTALEEYAEAIKLIAQFTVQSLSCFQFSPNSLHYLLGLWQRLTGHRV